MSQASSLENMRDKVIAMPSCRNEILDNERRYSKLNLMQYVDDGHLLKRMSKNVSDRTHLPINTVFIMGLSVFSSMAARKYCVLYHDGSLLPIGLYTVAEQPSGTGKTRCLGAFQQPFYEIHEKVKDENDKRIKKLMGKSEPTEKEAEELKELIEKSKHINPSLFVTNSTPEGLETTLVNTNGFFSAISSEQGLFNSLLGLSYKSGGGNNNDAMLFGFDGGYANPVRVSRQTYTGRIVGGVTCFAQHGSIEKVLDASNGTGLSERFLMLAEPHSLGSRDHTKVIFSDADTEKEYAKKCEFIDAVIKSPQRMMALCRLKISDCGFRMIAEYRNRIEPFLADAGKYSHVSLRGAASKIDMQIMKMAANLHILDKGSFEIDDKHIKTAIGIAGDLLEENLRLCREKGIIGLKAEFQSVITYLSGNNKMRTEREIINSLSKTRPFKDFTGNRSDLIRSSLNEMLDQRLIERVFSGGKVGYVVT